MTLKLLLVSLVLSAASGARGEGQEQRFALEPVDKTAQEGDTILLACRVVHKVGRIQWTRDSFGLGTERELVGYPRYSMTGSDEEGEYSLQIRDVRLEDEARFQCQVGAADGVRGIRSRDALLTVHVPPSAPVIVEGSVLRTTAGRTVALTCEALGGKPAAELTWFDQEGKQAAAEQVTYWTQLLPDGKRASAFSKWTFVADKRQDGATLTCRSENPALQQQQVTSTRLEVRFAPTVRLRMQAAGQHLLEGQDVVFLCETDANPASDLLYKWYVNEELVVGSVAASFALRSVSREHASVTCEARNAIGAGKARQLLNLHFGPVLRSPLHDHYPATLGQQVRLSCDVAGNPAPEVTWLFEGNVRATGADLLIPAMSYDQAGRYVCRASVAGFPEVETSTLLLIKGPPRVSAPAVQFGEVGSPATLDCRVHSLPQPSVSWTWDPKLPPFPSQQQQERLSTGDTTASLLIHEVRPELLGSFFNCSASNDFGSDHAIILLARPRMSASSLASSSHSPAPLSPSPAGPLPLLLTVAGAVAALLFLVSAAVAAILCCNKKTVYTGDSLSDLKGSDVSKASPPEEPRVKATAKATEEWTEGTETPAAVVTSAAEEDVDNAIYAHQQHLRWYSSSGKLVGRSPTPSLSLPIMR